MHCLVLISVTGIVKNLGNPFFPLLVMWLKLHCSERDLPEYGKSRMKMAPKGCEWHEMGGHGHS